MTIEKKLGIILREYLTKEVQAMIFFDEKTVKFLLIAMLNGVIGNIIMFGLYNLVHCSYWMSSAANYLVVGIMSFILNRKFTFQNAARLGETIPKYILNILLCYFLAYGIARPITLLLMQNFTLTWQENVAMFVGMWLYIILNYFGQRYFTFRE